MTERIGYNPYFYSYPQYLSNNWGVSNANRFTPNFRGDSVGVTSPQTSVNYTTPPDTVEISAGNKINEASTQEKQKTGMSTLAKVGIAIGGTALAGILAHKFIPPMRVQSRVQRIFLEDFTKEEAKAIQKKYQDILKISDKDEFIDKLFAELKKDYKLDNIPIKLDKTYKSGEKSGAIVGAAHFLPHHDKGFWEVGIDRKFSNEDILKHLTHELKHAKQDLIQYQVANRDDLISVHKDRIKDIFRGESWCQKKIDENATEMVDEIIKFYEKIGVKKIDSTDRNYDWGRKILNSYRTYANKSQEAYHTTFYETDAKSTERLMDKMVHNRLF